MQYNKKSNIQSNLNMLSVKIIKLSYFITALLFMIAGIGYLISNSITLSEGVKLALNFATASAVTSLVVSIQITIIWFVPDYTLNKLK